MPEPAVRLKFRIASILGARLLRAMRATWRIDDPDPGFVLRRRDERGRAGPVAPGAIYVQWHSRILLGAATQANRGVHVLISQHGDGEYIARTVERLGFATVRGSSTRGGARALRALVDTLESGGDVAFTPDGPKGPRLVVQPGCVEAASITGAPIVPVALECRRAKRLRSWDRFMIPWFFTKVAVRFGDEIRVPRDLDDASRAAWCRRVETALDAAHAQACAALGTTPELRG